MPLPNLERGSNSPSGLRFAVLAQQSDKGCGFWKRWGLGIETQKLPLPYARRYVHRNGNTS